MPSPWVDGVYGGDRLANSHKGARMFDTLAQTVTIAFVRDYNHLGEL